jgi:Arc/MetJ-type ribon-helix-helix transcriptional regulator
MPPIEREIMFHVRMAEHERKMLDQLAEDQGVSASDFVRMAIRREFIRRFGAERAVRSPTKRPPTIKGSRR